MYIYIYIIYIYKKREKKIKCLNMVSLACNSQNFLHQFPNLRYVSNKDKPLLRDLSRDYFSFNKLCICFFHLLRIFGYFC